MLKHQTRYRVIYGDTDKMGYVYNANYLRWFEIGRAELFRELGLPYREVEARGLLLPVSETYCKFISPVQYDDLIRIEAELDPTVRGGLKIDYRILSEDGARELARGYTKHACVDSRGRVVRPPAFLREFLAEKLSGQLKE